MTPDFSRGYLRIPLSVWRAVYCRGPLTRRQLQLVSVVVRETWGWQTAGGEVRGWTRPLLPRQFAEATGLSTDHIAQDVRRLVARGVLREQAGSYQFVPEVGLWESPYPRTPIQRRTPHEMLEGGAESALATSDVKKGKIAKENVPPPSWAELSPGGDNSPSQSGTQAESLPFPDALPLSSQAKTDRFVAVVVQFVGELSEAEIHALRAWVSHAGVAAVWETLAPSFRRGGKAVRRALHVHVAPYLHRREAANPNEGFHNA